MSDSVQNLKGSGTKIIGVWGSFLIFLNFFNFSLVCISLMSGQCFLGHYFFFFMIENLSVANLLCVDHDWIWLLDFKFKQ